MATEIDTSAVIADASKDTVSPGENLKNVLQTLVDQSAVIKALMVSVRNAIKESDKQSKELEKLRNKRSRNKTERSANSQPSGITKPVAISDELAKFLGVAPGTLVPRNEVTKGVSAFVKANGLSDPSNKQKFVLDDREHAKTLRTLLGNPSEDVTYFNLQRYLKHHYLPMESDKPPKAPKTPKAPAEPKAEAPKSAKASKSATPAPAPAETPAPASASTEAPAKKKILVKKKKSELAEEA
jgi:chromatin remodeling complex protein RSC6